MSRSVKTGWPSAVAAFTCEATAPNPCVYCRWTFCQVLPPAGIPAWLTSRVEIISTRRSPSMT